MDEKEKDLAGKIFKTCRALERISGSYFREEIDKTIFINLAENNLYELTNYFKLFLGR